MFICMLSTENILKDNAMFVHHNIVENKIPMQLKQLEQNESIMIAQ